MERAPSEPLANEEIDSKEASFSNAASTKVTLISLTNM
jgi:hypothetical protein